MQPHTAPPLRIMCGHFMHALAPKRASFTTKNTVVNGSQQNLNGFWTEEEDSDADDELVEKTNRLRLLNDLSPQMSTLDETTKQEKMEKDLKRLYKEINFSFE